MVVKFLAPAQAEFVEAVSYYESQRQGLGSQFAEEVKRTIQRVVQFPEAWAPISRRTRRCRTNRFPYGIIYQVRGDTLLIVGVMHLHREPQAWKDTLRGEKE